jgi:excisionase family DNA binding protein
MSRPDAAIGLAPETALARAIAEFVRAEVDQRVAAALAARPAVGELLSTAEAAAHAKVTPETIRRWVAAGKLPENRAGREVRIARVDLDKLLHRGTRRPRPQAGEKTPEQLARERFGIG